MSQHTVFVGYPMTKELADRVSELFTRLGKNDQETLQDLWDVAEQIPSEDREEERP